MTWLDPFSEDGDFVSANRDALGQSQGASFKFSGHLNAIRGRTFVDLSDLDEMAACMSSIMIHASRVYLAGEALLALPIACGPAIFKFRLRATRTSIDSRQSSVWELIA